MKQILEEEELIGKTIKSNGYGNNDFCLVFTDETFCIINGLGWDDDIAVGLSDNEINMTPDSFFYVNELFRMGLISEQEVEKIKEKNNLKRLKEEKERKEKEYHHYLALRSKYESE